MNPLNPWVALTEILILLGAAFGVGWGIAWLQHCRSMRAKQRDIRRLREERSGRNY